MIFYYPHTEGLKHIIIIKYDSTDIMTEPAPISGFDDIEFVYVDDIIEEYNYIGGMQNYDEDKWYLDPDSRGEQSLSEAQYTLIRYIIK